MPPSIVGTIILVKLCIKFADKTEWVGRRSKSLRKFMPKDFVFVGVATEHANVFFTDDESKVSELVGFAEFSAEFHENSNAEKIFS